MLGEKGSNIARLEAREGKEGGTGRSYGQQETSKEAFGMAEHKRESVSERERESKREGKERINGSDMRNYLKNGHHEERGRGRRRGNKSGGS